MLPHGSSRSACRWPSLRLQCTFPPSSCHQQAEVKLRGGRDDGRVVWLDYEDFSKHVGLLK